jgi:hypothetical protein
MSHISHYIGKHTLIYNARRGDYFLILEHCS